MATQRDPNRPERSPRNVAERLREEGKQKLAQGKSTAADQVDNVARALKRASNELDRIQPLLGAYATQLASAVGRLGARLRESSFDELVNDAQAAARRNPTLFVVGGLALGVVLARVIKVATAADEPLVLGTEYEEIDVADPLRSARRADGE